MKVFLLSLLSVMAAYKQCGKPAATATAATIPVCVQARIDSIKQLPRWNPPASVEEYRYGGRRVFLFSSNCCDNFNQAIDENCRYICAPSGGFTGKGDRNCVDFKEAAQFVRLVWKDERR